MSGNFRGVPGNPYKIPLKHPMADSVSFFAEPTNPYMFEAAFFIDNKWVVEPFPGLEKYRDWSDGADTCVYRYIPAEVLLALAGEYASTA